MHGASRNYRYVWDVSAPQPRINSLTSLAQCCQRSTAKKRRGGDLVAASQRSRTASAKSGWRSQESSNLNRHEEGGDPSPELRRRGEWSDPILVTTRREQSGNANSHSTET